MAPPLVEVQAHQDAKCIFEAAGARGLRLGQAHGCELVELTLAAAASLAPHRLPLPVTFVVLAGRGRLQAGGTAATLAAGDLVALAAGEERAWHNDGPEPLRLLVIKHPAG